MMKDLVLSDRKIRSKPSGDGPSLLQNLLGSKHLHLFESFSPTFMTHFKFIHLPSCKRLGHLPDQLIIHPSICRADELRIRGAPVNFKMPH